MGLPRNGRLAQLVRAPALKQRVVKLKKWAWSRKWLKMGRLAQLVRALALQAGPNFI